MLQKISDYKAYGHSVNYAGATTNPLADAISTCAKPQLSIEADTQGLINAKVVINSLPDTSVSTAMKRSKSLSDIKYFTPLNNNIRSESTHYLLQDSSDYQSTAKINNLIMPKNAYPTKFQKKDIGIIGGGFAGCLSAIQMSRAGHNVTIYEKNGLLEGASKIPAHLYGGGPGYSHLPAKERDEIFLSSLEFAKILPDAMNNRPTIFALKKNDSRTAEMLVSASERQASLYKSKVQEDYSNKVFGDVDKYYKSYTKEDILKLRTESNKLSGNDEWVRQWSKQLDANVIDELQWPIALVHEPGINVQRAKVSIRNELQNVDIKENTFVEPSNVQEKHIPGKPKKVQVTDHDKKKEFDYLINASGINTGKFDDKLNSSAQRSIDIKYAGAITSHQDMSNFPQSYIMGKPMVHITPYGASGCVLNVTNEDGTYVKNGKISAAPGQSSPDVPEQFLQELNGDVSPSSQRRVNNMLLHLSDLMPNIAGASTRVTAIPGYVPIPGTDLKSRSGAIRVGESSATIISPKATSSLEGKPIPYRISVGSRFEIPLPSNLSKLIHNKSNLHDIDRQVEANVKKDKLPTDFGHTYDSNQRRVSKLDKFKLPDGASILNVEPSLDGTVSSIKQAYRDAHGVESIIIGEETFKEIKKLGTGFGGEAFLFENPDNQNKIVVKKYFQYRSVESKGDMDKNIPVDPKKREELMKIQIEDFTTEKKALEEINKLASPYICDYAGFGTVEGRGYMALPFYNGGSVRNLLEKLDSFERSGEISQRDRTTIAKFIISQVSEGLKFMDGKAVHRDLKPDNILLQLDPEIASRKAKVISKIADFGTTAIEKAPTDTVVTTPHYKSPAYIAADKNGGHGLHDNHQDIWSLGISAIELAYGHRPFDGNLPEDEQKIYDSIEKYAESRDDSMLGLKGSSIDSWIKKALDPSCTFKDLDKLLEITEDEKDKAKKLIKKLI
ncbi:FAD-dependent oxidoreductase [Agarilytica rhodophyticola]|uniref:FAD-dependent oxidoreductase n=1 Tax=Agarilytica rhodophyticola TaxID=1737490 RepID=UPI000B345117|nr:FAD-dependent oxidoreductase [Agarilytica rhodophyticola]